MNIYDLIVTNKNTLPSWNEKVDKEIRLLQITTQ